MRIQDHTSKPCTCGECQQAGVSDRPQVRDPQSGRMLHGYPLKAYWAQADAMVERMRRIIAEKAIK